MPNTPIRLGDNVYPNLAFIGAGNMARAIIAGLVKTGYPKKAICVSAPSLQNREFISNTYGVLHKEDNKRNAKEAHAIILAVKPQMMQEVCLKLKNEVNLKDKLVITLAAGIDTAQYKKWLGESVQIVRVMPNTPALIGEGMSGIFCPLQTSEGAKLFVQKLMKSVGEVCFLEDESQMHAFIATAGSSPAYFFKFMQFIEASAIQLGCSKEEAKRLVLQSAKGAILLACEAPELSFQTLADQVTSKGGTTEQALNTFDKLDLEMTIKAAMSAAAEKSKAMSISFAEDNS
ncbi:pyrroline-5-carboxylate reductase [Thorsellia kenyensis]|uniref:Pyrroline-5-carboxylate reductase n=1 Tax=Thorsellia kenyensis TaxID=1549888 RepID=A0ABV6CD02_9GAMM